MSSTSYNRLRAIAEHLTRGELIAIWVTGLIRDGADDATLNTWLTDLAKFSHEEILDVLDEISPSGEQLLMTTKVAGVLP